MVWSQVRDLRSLKYPLVVISQRSYFSEFDTAIDERISELRKNHSWGGNLEIAAISKLYKVGIVVWELSKTGQLVTPINEPRSIIAAEDSMNLNLVRHRGVHYNCAFKKKKAPLLTQTINISNCDETKNDRVPLNNYVWDERTEVKMQMAEPGLVGEGVISQRTDDDFRSNTHSGEELIFKPVGGDCDIIPRDIKELKSGSSSLSISLYFISLS